MFSKMTASLLGSCALALSLVAGFATTANAQPGVLCQYFTGQFDPLDIQSTISEPFFVQAYALQTNSQATKIIKASSVTDTELNEVGDINSGFLVAEVDAKFKQLNNDPSTTCPNNAKVSGAGLLFVGGDDLILRSNSRMDGKTRVGTVANGPVGDAEINSVHRVNASLRYTAQGLRNNDSLLYDRGTINTAALYEAVEQRPRGRDEDVLLICTCLDEIE